LKKQAAVEEANPLSPWLWRNGLGFAPRGKSKQEERNLLLGTAIFLQMITLPDLLPGGSESCQTSDPRVFLVLVLI